jgi:hypothetical protein
MLGFALHDHDIGSHLAAGLELFSHSAGVSISNGLEFLPKPA